MGRHHVSATGNIAAPIDVVWAILADHRRYHRWGFMARSELEREGVPDPDGVGAIRVLGTGTSVSREEIVAFEPPTHLGYTLLSGLPVRRYRADVRLTDYHGVRTLVTWSGEFDAMPGLGRPMVAFLHIVLVEFVRRLSSASRRQAVGR
jgi:uncharacterized protein YndB with AHSA1/START domain